jgi:peptidoglycan hydrolase CwlO-like protein
MGKLLGWILTTVLGASLLALGATVYAQSDANYLPNGITTTDTDQVRAKLQAQLDDLEKQIAQQQAILDQTKGQDVNLSNEIKKLNAQITQTQLEIKARDVAMQQISGNISKKQRDILGLNTQLGRELESLAAILREKFQLDNTSLVEAALSSATLSDFFSDVDSFDQINADLQASFMKISSTKNQTQAVQDELQSQLDAQTKLLQAQQLEQQQISKQQTQKQKVLADTKGQEKAYQTLITQNQKTAAQIKATLFQLTGATAIPFGQALQFAQEAQQKTGIRPAFLLGIITEESNLGQNVGKGTYQVDMHPTRDVPIFKAVTASLGLDPNTMPVSKKQWYGWGGAMGPAQFIPSTWALYAGYVKPDYHYEQSRDKIGKLTGNTPPNPWSPEDAFMAAALLLTDSGAAAQTSSAEFKAAMCYLAGCGNVNDSSLQFYGNQVADYAHDYQCQINVINSLPTTADCNY